MCHIMLNAIKSSKKGRTNIMGHVMEHNLLFPNFQLFAGFPSSDLADVIRESLAFLDRHPALLAMVDADLDAYGLQKKAQRLQRQRELLASHPSLGIGETPTTDTVDMTLAAGRPRTPALVVFLFLILRGRYGSASDQDVCERFRESKSMEYLLAARGYRMPSRQTLVDNLNAVSNATREAILDAQVEDCRTEGLDDFNEIAIDSTAVCACSAWPNDASLGARSLQRACRELAVLRDMGLVDYRDGWKLRWREQVVSLARGINMLRGKKANAKRRQLYRKLVNTMEKLMVSIKEIYKLLLSEDTSRLHVTVRTVRERHLLNGVRALINGWKASNQIQARVLEHQTLPMDEKLLSLADSDATLIIKGDRQTVLGYRPGLSRSREGFIVDLALEKGNTSDARVLIKTVQAVASRTGAVPQKVTTDDGYASTKNMADLERLGVGLVTFSGAKGKKITPQKVWDSEEAIEQRARRSAVESLMAVMKGDYFFARMRRCGVENVRAEMLEKVLAYNFDRILLVRERKIQEQRSAPMIA